MRRYLFWLVVLLLVCWGLYTANVSYGQPVPEYSPSTVQNGWLNSANIYHPDSYEYVSRPYSFLLRKLNVLKTNYYHNPSVAVNLNLIFSWVTGVTRLYDGPFDPTARLPNGTVLNCEVGTPPNPVCLRQISPFSVYVVGRFISALLCLLSAAITYASGRKLFNRSVGLLAAALVGLCPMVVQNAHYELPGAPTLMFSTAALWLSIVLFKQPRRKWVLYAVVGLMVGFAISSRYNAAEVGVMLVFALFVAWREMRQWRLAAVAMIAIPIGFVIGTPGSIFEFRFFLEQVEYILYWYKVLGGGPGWTAASAGAAMFDNWHYGILYVVGPVAAVLAVVGAATLLRRYRRDQRDFWLGAAFVVYLVVYTATVFNSKRIAANLFIPMIAPIALLAAYGVFKGLSRFTVRRGAVIGLLSVVVLVWPAYLSVYLANLFVMPDTRLNAQAWIFQHIPTGTAIHLFGSYNVPIDPLVYPTTQTFGAQAPLDDPLWNTPIIVYSDAYPRSVLRDPSLTEDPADVENTRAIIQRLQSQWIELARFPRVYWPGEDTPPDDVSFLHQMEIVVYCNPANCPVKPG